MVRMKTCTKLLFSSYTQVYDSNLIACKTVEKGKYYITDLFLLPIRLFSISFCSLLLISRILLKNLKGLPKSLITAYQTGIQQFRKN